MFLFKSLKRGTKNNKKVDDSCGSKTTATSTNQHNANRNSTSTLPQATLKPLTGHNPWLDAWHDTRASMCCFTSQMCFADLYGNGEVQLVLSNLEKRLCVMSGTSVSSELTVPDLPVAIKAFYPKLEKGSSSMISSPSCPLTFALLAVAAGRTVYVYQHLQPHIKFRLPVLKAHPEEAEIWSRLKTSSIDGQTAIRHLAFLRERGVPLLNKSVDLLSLTEDTNEIQMEFILGVKDAPLLQFPAITCMEVLQQTGEDPTGVSPSMLVIGTEQQAILVLPPSTDRIDCEFQLPGIPVLLHCEGVYNCDYRITVSCRNRRIYTIRSGNLLSVILTLETPCVGIGRTSKHLFAACMDNAVHCFDSKGTKEYTVSMSSPITNFSVLKLSGISNTRAVFLVALQNGEVRLYSGRSFIHSLHTNEIVTGMLFGYYGREENVLALSFRAGTLSIKILKICDVVALQTASGPNPPAEQNIPLDVPEKTKLYVEQIDREREQAQDMYSTFQRDLCRLRVTSCKKYIDLLNESDPHSLKQAMDAENSECGRSLSMTAEVYGSGPLFVVRIRLQHEFKGEQHSDTIRKTKPSPIHDLYLACNINPKLYRLSKPLVKVAPILPFKTQIITIPVQCINIEGGRDSLQVLACKKDSPYPLVALYVTLPVSELLKEQDEDT